MATFSVTYSSEGFVIEGSGGDGDTVAKFPLFTAAGTCRVQVVGELRSPQGGTSSGQFSPIVYTNSDSASESGAFSLLIPSHNTGGVGFRYYGDTYTHSGGADVSFELRQFGTFDSTYSFRVVVKVL